MSRESTSAPSVSRAVPIYCERWSLIFAVTMLTSLALLTIGNQSLAIVPIIYGSALLSTALFTWFFYRTGAYRRPADWISLLRVALAASLFVSFAADSQLTNSRVVLAISILALDGLDGIVARRLGPTSTGAILDMEADSFFTYVLCSIVIFCRGGTAWLAVIAALRPVYVVGSALVRPWINFTSTDLRPTLRGKLICVVTIIVMLANLVPMLAAFDLSTINFFAAGLLLYSFGRDTVRSLADSTIPAQ